MKSFRLQAPAPEDLDGGFTSGDLIIASLENLKCKDFERFRDKLSDFYYKNMSPVPRGPLENANAVDTKNLLIDFYGEVAALDATVKALKSISLMGPAEELQMKISQHDVRKTTLVDNRIEDFRKKYMTLMKERYQSHRDGNACLGDTVHLNRRYTRLLLIKKQLNLKEREHEIMSLGQRHQEIMDERSSSQYSPITIEGLFDPDEDGIVPKIVVLQGPAGVGKTMTSQKIILDWASGDIYQDKFYLAFYISCRELNNLSGGTSLAGLLRKMCYIICGRDLLQLVLDDSQKLLFLVDGFDELRRTPASDTEVCEDPFQETSKEILLNTIFRQSCLWGASVIITTRPYSMEQLKELFPCPRHVEILGFTGRDREQFVFSFFREKEQANLALGIMKDDDTLFTMCAIPITCWILCTVIKQQLAEGQREIDCRTTTSIYFLYLKSLLKYHCRSSDQSVVKCVRKICALANEGVWSQKILFEEDDLRRHKLTMTDIESVFLNEDVFQRNVETKTCYSFIHLTVQEFFASLYYVMGNKSKIKNDQIKKLLNEGKYKSHLQLTIQFLFGLLSKKQQGEAVRVFGCDQFSFKENSVMVDWLIKNPGCKWSLKYLYESQDENLIGRIMAQCPDVRFFNPKPSVDYRALAYCLKNSRSEHRIVFINCLISPKARTLLSSALHKCSQVRFSHCLFLYNEEDEKLPSAKSSLVGLFNCQPGIKKLVLMHCGLTFLCCDDLCSLIITNRSLRKLLLKGNNLRNAGVKRLCEGLQDPGCKLEELRLEACFLTSFCCEDIRSTIITNHSLIELDLTLNNLNKLQDSGIRSLYEGLEHPDCTLQELWITKEGVTRNLVSDLEYKKPKKAFLPKWFR